MDYIIKIENVVFRFPAKGASAEKIIFDGLSLRFNRGGKYVIGGRSGTGKTTLLRLIAWLEQPDSGGMTFNDKPYESYYPPFLRSRITLAPQTPVMLDGTTRRNLSLGLASVPDDKTIIDWLEKFELEPEILDRPAKSLSIGQQQRVAVIRALLLHPDALLLDEPTSGLDPKSTEVFIKSMENLVADNNLTLIWNSHDLKTLEGMATEVIMIGDDK